MIDRTFRGLRRRDVATVSVLFVGYAAALAIGRTQVDGRDPDWQQWVLAGVTIALAVAVVVVLVRAGRRSQELERLVFSESSSLAFFATMVAAVTYALLESLVDAPALSAWAVWAFGMGTWVVASVALDRSMR